MTDRKWIIFFGEDWGRHHSTGQYLAKELEKEGYHILWVNSLGMRAPKLNLGDAKRIVSKLKESVFDRKKAAVGENEEQKNIHVITPITIPLFKYSLVRWINRQILKRLFRKAYLHYNIAEPYVITACPSTTVVLDDLPAKVKAYYCADEYASIAGMDATLVQQLEDKLLKQVEVVLVTARALQEQKQSKHEHVYYLPHGVDYPHFCKALQFSRETPHEMKLFSRPIVGFVGLIGEHIDLDLLNYTAKELPEYSFVMIGPVEEGIEVPQAGNIHYLGMKPFDELPQYIAHFDVAILPYANTRRNQFANPTKVREYLAAGSPVVCTNQQEVKNIDSAVFVATTADEFVSEIRKVVAGGYLPSKQAISDTMKNQTWSARSAEMISYLKSCDE
ncbi:MAG: glycosyltransferase [Gammaproteobacteria bacterium]|nr:glycosyltransferase [Gammaproteobacteria bacterium]MCF6230735.1 glycosyltransferase [Gammaproteobacteria bacterium]